jgi:hypothetical protein
MYMLQYGIDHINATRLFEYQTYLGFQIMFNSLVGLWAARKAMPFQSVAAKTYPLFRKAWMRFPIALTAFGCAYYGAG